MTSITILQTPEFKRVYKKLHNNQKMAVNEAVIDITNNPLIGVPKKGDLAGVYVYKFNCINQEYLLAYEYDKTKRLLLALGIHENFYRDLKRKR